MTIETPERHVVAIQMLRGIAATMVVFVHLDTELDRLHFQRLGSDWLATGVDIFFVISGFIMWTSVERRRGISAGEFLKNRIIRIVPLYWLMTSLLVFVALVAPQLLRTTKLEPAHAIASYLFLPARHPTTHNFWPLLVPGWSLNYEMLFYVIFATALLLSAGARVARFAWIAGMIVGVLLAARAAEGRLDVMHFYANSVMLEFLVGMVLGVICTNGWVRSSYAFLPITILGFIVLWPGAHLYSWLPAAGVGATMIVGGAIFLPQIRPNPLSRLGDASYSLYLIHAMLLAAFTTVWEWLGIRPVMPLFIGASLAIAFAGAFVVYTCFEVPVTEALKRRYRHPRPQEPSVRPLEAIPDPDAASGSTLPG